MRLVERTGGTVWGSVSDETWSGGFGRGEGLLGKMEVVLVIGRKFYEAMLASSCYQYLLIFSYKYISWNA